VIAGRAIAIAEYRVVEQVRQGGNRAIKTGFAMRPPIGVLKNEIQVLRRGLPYARVLQDQRFVVQREAGAEGIRIGQQSGGTESDRDQQAARRFAPSREAFRRPACRGSFLDDMKLQTNRTPFAYGSTKSALLDEVRSRSAKRNCGRSGRG